MVLNWGLGCKGGNRKTGPSGSADHPGLQTYQIVAENKGKHMIFVYN